MLTQRRVDGLSEKTRIECVNYGDLTGYGYAPQFAAGAPRNAGWLGADTRWTATPPSSELLDALWAVTHVVVAPSRGFHFCELCGKEEVVTAQRLGERLLLGHAEIRVFVGAGEVYAAPDMLFHCVERHGYPPPTEFVRALMSSPRPPDAAYFARLSAVDLSWSDAMLCPPGGLVLQPRLMSP